MNVIKNTLTTVLILMVVVCGTAAAQNVPSSDVLLPYFEVDAANAAGLTTLFAVGNALDERVDVLAAVHTNWGIPILEVPFTLEPREVRTINLRDWFRTGGNPNKTLAAAELQHLAAAASGRRSPKDDLYYSSEVRPDLQVGYVTLRTQGDRPDALWGDWFNVDVAGNLARGDVLANIDRSTGCPGLCRRHLLRYLAGGGFDGGTEIVIWRDSIGQPSTNPQGGARMLADATAFDEPGRPLENRQLSLLPVEKVLVSELGFKEPFGTLDVESEEDTFFAVQHTVESRYSVGLTTYCLPRKPKPGAGIEILKVTNGEDADTAPGPSIAVGADVTWEYLVSNTGAVELTGIVVEDDDPSLSVSCPGDTLAPGESMTCAASGKARACQYTNLGSVSGLTASGATVHDSDRSHYFGEDGSALSLAVLLNGQNAESAPGVTVDAGAALSWIFRVTNTGGTGLDEVKVAGAACPKSRLAAGESMDCSASGKALSGQHSLPAQATARGACSQLSADAVGYYQTPPENECTVKSGISIETKVNGQDADSPKGPEVAAGSTVSFAYVVANTGDDDLTGIQVSDSKGLSLTCPGSTLAAGASMTCTASGTAQSGQWSSVGAATATGTCGEVSDDDPVHYYGGTTGGAQGCSHGYWKNHEKSWPATGYSTGQSVSSAFGQAALYPSLGSATLHGSLSFNGGPDVTSAAANMLKQATGSLLNSAHPGVDFPWTTAQLVSDVNAALASQDTGTLSALATALDQANNLGCPLN